MGVQVKNSDEARHWSRVDLWSDGVRHREFTEAPLSVDGETEPASLREARVGLDIPLQLTTENVTDQELLRYLNSPSMSGWSYHLLRLACSFKSGSGERFASGELDVHLRVRDAIESQAVAWSITPLVLLDGDDRTDTFTVGAGLKFVNAQASRQTKASQGALVRAYGMLTADPGWRFAPTRIRDLDGTFELGLIVRSPSDALVHGEVNLDIVLEKSRWLPIQRSAKVNGAVRLEAVFQGAGQPAAVHLLI